MSNPQSLDDLLSIEYETIVKKKGNRYIARIRELMRTKAPETAYSNRDPAENADEHPRILALPCPHCAGRMVIVESFPPGCQPRAPPKPRRAAA